MPFVSVITPAYNAAAFLAGTIESVLAQTFRDFEYIIVDDGSTDSTLEVARSFESRDSRVRVIAASASRHPGTTRNRGIAASTGKYIAFVDADDIWLPDKLEKQLAKLRAVQEPGLCYCYVQEFRDDGAPVAPIWPRKSSGETREEQYRRNLVHRQYPCTSSLIIERALLDEIGPFTDSPILTVGEDLDLVLRALARRPMILVPEELVRYRVRGDSATWARGRRWEHRFELVRRADERGELTPFLRSAALSAAYQVKAEVLLDRREAGWRAAFLRAFATSANNPKRWANLPAVVLPAPMMRRYYAAVKSLQG